jgi:hypothetical protein
LCPRHTFSILYLYRSPAFTFSPKPIKSRNNFIYIKARSSNFNIHPFILSHANLHLARRLLHHQKPGSEIMARRSKLDLRVGSEKSWFGGCAENFLRHRRFFVDYDDRAIGCGVVGEKEICEDDGRVGEDAEERGEVGGVELKRKFGEF